MQLARKHHVQTEYLAEHHGQLKAELSELSSDASRLDEIQQQLDDSKLAYIKNAQKLSQSRQRYAKELNKLVTQSIHELNMPKGKFNIAVNFNPESQSLMGSDQIEFQVTTNPGQPLQPIEYKHSCPVHHHQKLKRLFFLS